MRIPRTCRIQESTLKAYFYLRATFKIESNESESFVFEQIILEGMQKVEEIKKNNKTIIYASTKGTRYVIGGNLSEETNDSLTRLCEEHSWKIQECVEVLIYFCSLERFTEEEMKFFGLDEMKIVVV